MNKNNLKFVDWADRKIANSHIIFANDKFVLIKYMSKRYNLYSCITKSSSMIRSVYCPDEQKYYFEVDAENKIIDFKSLNLYVNSLNLIYVKNGSDTKKLNKHLTKISKLVAFI